MNTPQIVCWNVCMRSGRSHWNWFLFSELWGWTKTKSVWFRLFGSISGQMGRLCLWALKGIKAAWFELDRQTLDLTFVVLDSSFAFLFLRLILNQSVWKGRRNHFPSLCSSDWNMWGSNGCRRRSARRLMSNTILFCSFRDPKSRRVEETPAITPPTWTSY